ncbi:helicase [archaeon]|jgi:superfamily II DNA/RNA helicase/HKD family nuclease|nr:helicase [archaeon]MBT4241483.1 helicase [archaeon]MBT4417646.1 helicase [archaeon]
MGSFITNQEENKLSPILTEQLSSSKEFDCLVAYLYKSGFYKIHDYLENVEEIKILTGIAMDDKFYDEIKSINELTEKEIKKEHKKQTLKDIDSAEFKLDVEEGVNKLKNWIKSRKLKIRACKNRTHAKVYIMTYDKNNSRQLQPGTVITGSSNLTKAGLEDNIEFNVFLQDKEDYIEIKKIFDDLWENHSVDVSELHVQTIEKNSQFREDITPYEFYLKFLQEYFKDELDFEERKISAPTHLMDLDYQKDAVGRARKILNKYGGVFISDVVGLGKTFITTMLMKELPGKTLVIAPPMLVNKENPGSWQNVFDSFEILRNKGEFESIGKLDKILRKGVDDYDNIVIDEAHRFRNENTKMYSQLSAICRGKNVILVTATPLNNRPDDLKNQIALFTPMKNAKFHPSIKDLDRYFTEIRSKRVKLKKELNEEKISRKEYLDELKKISDDIRNRILRKVMIRRTRSDIKKLFSQDMDKQGLRFPKVNTPKTLYYEFDEKLDGIFEETLELLLDEKNMKYCRYAPILYLKKDIDENKKTPQKNIKHFMKILVAKRLESSFHAFRESVKRFIRHYEASIKSYDEKGFIVVSEDYYAKVFDFIEGERWEEIEKLVQNEKGKKYLKKEFKPSFRKLLESDLNNLKKIQEIWEKVKIDPKLNSFRDFLNKLPENEKKIIVFSESKDTIDYLKKELNRKDVITFSGSSGEKLKEEVIENFDHFSKNQKNDYNVLISTDTLSEGVNLNRANKVLNYDIPWNPVRVIQRVGRIDRVAKDLPFNEINTYNFFPAKKINDKIKLQENAEEKIKAFIRLLGNDSKLLFEDEEILSHKEFFQRLQSSVQQEDSLTTMEDTERMFIRNIRENNRELFKKIESLPGKIKLGRKKKNSELFSFFKKGNFKFAYSYDKNEVGEVIDFEKIIEIIKAEKNEKSINLDKKDFYKKFAKLREKFLEDCKPKKKMGAGLTGNAKIIMNKIVLMKKDKRLYEKELDMLEKIEDLLKEKKIPDSKSLKKVVKLDNVEAYTFLMGNIPKEFFKKYRIEENEEDNKDKPEEIILSEWFV